jgi:hypothetical protein
VTPGPLWTPNQNYVSSDPFRAAAERPEAGVRVKGREPRIKYQHNFAGIYQDTPAKSLGETGKSIQHEVGRFYRVAGRISAGLEDADIIPLLLCPVPDISAASYTATILTSPKAVALQLARSPIEKLAHSFTWIDVNLKLRVEDVCTYAGLSENVARAAVESAESIYALLLKADDYTLARIITFNESAFVQQRIVEVLFGHVGMLTLAHQEHAQQLNDLASKVISDFATSTLADMLVESILAGGVMAQVSRGASLMEATEGEAFSAALNEALDRFQRSGTHHRWSQSSGLVF